MQKESVDFVKDKMFNGSHEVEFGFSSSISYGDNGLDSVSATIDNGSIAVSSTGSKLVFDYVLDADSGNGTVINSDIIYIDGYAINKNKFSDTNKTSDKLIDSRQTLFVQVE